jgi:exopolysaccharide biosynthesis protein
LLLPAGSDSAESPRFWLAARSSTGFTVPIAPGVVYSRYRVVTSRGPLRIHHLSLNLSIPTVRLGVGLAHNQLISEDETVSSIVRRSGAVAGVNGDFFDIGDSGMPLNIVVQDGQLLRSPAARPALAIGKDGSVRITRYWWNGSILLPSTNVTHWIVGFNTGLAPDGIVVLSNVRGYGAPVPDRGMRQTVVELVPLEEPSRTVRTSTAQITSSSPDEWPRYTVKQIWQQQAYYAPFPKGVILLVGCGRAADWLTRNVAAGIFIDVKLATSPDWRTLHGAIGGGPVLVQNGRVVDDPHSPVPHERNHRNPVLAVGISRDRQTMLVVGVDGRQRRRSIGLTQPQLAAYMQRLGAYQAMAFDSGGSVTMVARLPGRPTPTIVNSPSDGQERPVANALLVFSRSDKLPRR